MISDDVMFQGRVSVYVWGLWSVCRRDGAHEEGISLWMRWGRYICARGPLVGQRLVYMEEAYFC